MWRGDSWIRYKVRDGNKTIIFDEFLDKETSKRKYKIKYEGKGICSISGEPCNYDEYSSFCSKYSEIKVISEDELSKFLKGKTFEKRKVEVIHVRRLVEVEEKI